MERIRRFLNISQYKDIPDKKPSFSVVILDSGIIPHPDFGDTEIIFRDFVQNFDKPYDDYGHGTHVAGIISGNGIAKKGLYKGIYPGCPLICLKVLDQYGNGKAQHMCEALEWIIKNKEKFNIRIVNISLSFNDGAPNEYKDVLMDFIVALYKNGIIVVAAAGNNGPKPGSISSIADIKDVIAVGCYDKDYKSRFGKNCEDYSACGPGKVSFRKPDIVAPGTDIISCNNNFIHGNFYTRKSGTSMAAAIVSGCIALTLAANEKISPKEMQFILRKNAVDQNKPWNKQGWGMINVKGMIKSAMFG